MPRGGAKPGERRGGRKKGTPNKKSAEVKEALQLAFIGIGGVPTLQRWADQNKTEFFKLWGKLLPLQISTPEGESLLVKVIDLSRGPNGNGNQTEPAPSGA